MNDFDAAGTTAAFPTWLLRSKVSPTRQRVDLLERRSLTLLLHQSLDATLSLIHAPAGYGKSTLLSDWRRLLLEQGHRVCWLSLGESDNDPLHLLSYLAFSLAQSGVRFEADGVAHSQHLGDLSPRDCLALILHFVSETPGKIVLMLDDFENLRADTVARVIEPLLEHAPDHLHIAIATRDDSHLHISSFESRGQAIRVGAGQLKFSQRELSTFLAKELPPQTIQQLYSATEGWPVAVQMIRSTRHVDGEVERIVRDLSKAPPHVAAYLSEEVIGGLDPDLQEFLMDISIIERLDCAFADYLCDRNDSRRRFDRARTLDALLLPVDSVDSTYRLHPLFREHLYQRLAHNQPERLQRLHLRAADWYSDHGDLVEAVQHCVKASQPQHAIGIIERAGGVMLWFKEGLTRLRAVMRLIESGPEVRDWRLELIRCLLDVKDGEVHRARLRYDATVAGRDSAAMKAAMGHERKGISDLVMIDTVISIYEGKPISADFCRTLEHTVAMLGESDSALKANLLTVLCVSHLQLGQLQQARKSGEAAVPFFLSVGSIYGATYIYFHLGEIGFAQGRREDAARYYQMAWDLTRKHFNDDAGIKLVSSILLSELNYEVHDTDSTPGIAKSAPKLLERHEAWFDIYAAGYTTSAHRELDERGIDAAMTVVDNAVEYAGTNDLFRLTKLLACIRAELLLKVSRVQEARQALRSADITIDDYEAASQHQIGWRERDAAVVVISRLLLREGDFEQAIRILDHFSREARDNGHVRASMKYSLLAAIAYEKTGDAVRQTQHLREALQIAGRSGFVRAFIDEKDELEPMLCRYIADAPESGTVAPHLETVQAILGHLASLPSDRSIEPPLSRTENKVLNELGQGYSNKNIARRIDVSESTVRFHLRNIFVKLNVSSRLQAVAIARQKNLI